MFYITKFEEAVYVPHAFQKKTQKPESKTLPVASSATRRRNVLTGSNKQRQNVQIMRGSDNVFEDLGFAVEEAANLRVRADLMLDLRRYIQERGWTQEEAATFFGETAHQQPAQGGDQSV